MLKMFFSSFSLDQHQKSPFEQDLINTIPKTGDRMKILITGSGCMTGQAVTRKLSSHELFTPKKYQLNITDITR